jgi:hypothetical protein
MRSRQRGFLLNPYRFAAGDPLTDSNYASVSLLMHFDGANGSTTFTDHSPSPRTMGAVSAGALPTISTAQSVYGGASGVLDAALGQAIKTTSNAVYDMGTGDFTIEGRVRFSNAASVREFVLGQADIGAATAHTSFYIARTAAGKLFGTCNNAGTGGFGGCTGTTTTAANTWYAFAYVRSGTGFTLYVDGVSEATATSSNSVHSSTQDFAIAALGSYNMENMAGYVDEIRITKGVARYTGNYTLRGSAFPNSA